MEIVENLHAFLWRSASSNNCNTYLLEGSKRILIDPGHANLFKHVENGLSELNIKLGDIDVVVCTHAHPDHMEGIQFFRKEKALYAMHKKDWELVRSMGAYVGATYGVDIEDLEPDFFLEEGELQIGNFEFAVFHTPGHSPGSICLYWARQKVLFTGDLIFKEGLGRTDLPGGNSEQLKESIDRLSGLEVTHLLSGHGDVISGEKEVKDNFNYLKRFYFSYI